MQISGYLKQIRNPWDKLLLLLIFHRNQQSRSLIMLPRKPTPTSKKDCLTCDDMESPGLVCPVSKFLQPQSFKWSEDLGIENQILYCLVDSPSESLDCLPCFTSRTLSRTLEIRFHCPMSIEPGYVICLRYSQSCLHGNLELCVFTYYSSMICKS